MSTLSVDIPSLGETSFMCTLPLIIGGLGDGETLGDMDGETDGETLGIIPNKTYQ